VVHRGEVCPAEHEPILARELFDAVRVKLANQHQTFLRGRTGSAALLMGKIYDDRGNRMTPTHAQNAGRRYRYYVSKRFSRRGDWRRKPPALRPPDRAKTRTATVRLS
jgi:site-specific DNA recombinase